MKTYKLHLIRHGLTQGNLDGIFVGGGMDMPVCAAGRAGLHELRSKYRYPQVELLFSSPMARAIESADILYPDVSQRMILEDLRESRFGEFEGKPMSELMQDGNFAKWMDSASSFTPKGGESGQAFGARTARALITMMQYLAKNGISEAACVAHGGVIMSMLGQKALPKKHMAEWMTDNGCGYTVQADAAMLMRDELVEAVAVVPAGYMESK